MLNDGNVPEKCIEKQWNGNVSVKRDTNSEYQQGYLIRNGAGYTSDFVRAICCKSQVRFAVPAIWTRTRITFYIFCTKSQM
jgi:hypothetical protein